MEQNADQSMTMAERGRRGGLVTLERHGAEHFRKLQALSWQKQISDNPRAGERLWRAGVRAQDPVPENGAFQPYREQEDA